MTGRRFLNGVGLALVAIASWSVVGVIVGFALDDPPTAWLFLWALLGSGFTLIAISFVEHRLDA